MKFISTDTNQRTPARITRDFMIDLFTANQLAAQRAEQVSRELALSIATLKTTAQAIGNTPEGATLAGTVRNLEAIFEEVVWLQVSLSNEGFGGEA